MSDEKRMLQAAFGLISSVPDGSHTSAWHRMARSWVNDWAYYADGSNDAQETIKTEPERVWVDEYAPREPGKARAAVIRYPGGWFKGVAIGPGGGFSGMIDGLKPTFEEAAKEALGMVLRDYPFDVKGEITFLSGED